MKLHAAFHRVLSCGADSQDADAWLWPEEAYPRNVFPRLHPHQHAIPVSGSNASPPPLRSLPLLFIIRARAVHRRTPAIRLAVTWSTQRRRRTGRLISTMPSARAAHGTTSSGPCASRRSVRFIFLSLAARAFLGLRLIFGGGWVQAGSSHGTGSRTRPSLGCAHSHAASRRGMPSVCSSKPTAPTHSLRRRRRAGRGERRGRVHRWSIGMLRIASARGRARWRACATATARGPS